VKRVSCQSVEMSKRMNEYKHDLKRLANYSPSQARRLIQQSNDEFICAIRDVVWTTLAGKVPLSSEQREQVRSVQHTLRRFASRERSVEERRRVLVTRKGVRAIQTVFDFAQWYF